MFFHLLLGSLFILLNCMSFWLWYCWEKYKCCCFVHLLHSLSIYVISLLPLVFPFQNSHYLNRNILFSNVICNTLSSFISFTRCFFFFFNWHFLTVLVFILTCAKIICFLCNVLWNFIISIAQFQLQLLENEYICRPNFTTKNLLKKI